MRLKILTLFLLSGVGLCCAQMKPIAVGPPTTNGVQALVLPTNWAGAGAGYDPVSSPKVTSWVSIAMLINQVQKLYSYSSYDVITVSGKTPTVSARTGVGTVVRSFGPGWNLIAFGTAGVSQTATATTGSFSAGGMLFWQFYKSYTWEAGYRFVTGSTTNKVMEMGFGKVW